MNHNYLIDKYKELPIQIKASLWFLICAFFQKGISALIIPILTRLLSTTEYGQYSVFNSWQGIINCLITLNLYGGMYAQGLVKHEGKDRREFISSLQGLTFVLVVGWSIVYVIGYKFWNNLFSLTTQQMILMFLIIWATAVFNFWSVEQRINLEYKKLVGITLTASVADSLLGIILINICQNRVTARIFATAIVEVFLYTFLFIDQMKKGKVFYLRDKWKYALTFCISLIPHYLSQIVLNSSDRIMIQRLVNDSSAGIYSLAYSVSMIMSLFNTSLLQTIEPWLYQKIKNNEIDYIKKVAYPSFALVAGVNILLIAFAPEIVRIFAPFAYYEAVWVIPPVTMSVFFMFLYSFFVLFEFYFEKPQYITAATMTGAILNIVLNYIFIERYGYVAAGYTTLICYFIYALMHYFFMNKIVKDNLNGVRVYDTRIIVVITVGFVFLAFGLMVTYNYPVVRYSVLLVIVLIIIVNKKLIFDTVKNFVSLKSKQ